MQINEDTTLSHYFVQRLCFLPFLINVLSGLNSLPSLVPSFGCDHLHFPSWCFLSASFSVSLHSHSWSEDSASKALESFFFSQQLKGLVSLSQGLLFLHLLTPPSPPCCLQAFFFCPICFLLDYLFLTGPYPFLSSSRFPLLLQIPFALPLADTG